MQNQQNKSTLLNAQQQLEELQDIEEIEDILAVAQDNRRITTRYVREDIKASVNKVRLFPFGKSITIELFDLSTRGALIALDKELKLSKKLTLILEFEDGKLFEIAAHIVRKKDTINTMYGIKFERYNNALGDYLLETQKHLVFK